MSRYSGKPLREFVEAYFLDAIGEMDAARRSSTESQQPRLSRLYGCDGTWQEIVVSRMGFADALPEAVRLLWLHYNRHCEALHIPADPQEFVAQYVDRNLPQVAR